MIFLICLAAYFWLMSVFAFLAFVRDKEQAIQGGWRVPESTLLTLALLGGWPGAKLAQHRFHHKTRKEPFRSILNACALGPLLIALLGITAVFRPQADTGFPHGLAWAYALVGSLVGAGEVHAPESPTRGVTINRGGVRETVILRD